MRDLWNHLRHSATVSLGLALLFSSAATTELSATTRYARGEAVDLALIIDEWQQRMPQIPIFTCICEAQTCETKPRWPLRSYGQGDTLLAIGADNARHNETQGFGCVALAQGHSPSEMPQAAIPRVAAAIAPNGQSLTLSHNGQSRTIQPTLWKANLLPAAHCPQHPPRAVQKLPVRRLVGQASVDPTSGNVAVAALLDDCTGAEAIAIFIVEIQDGDLQRLALHRLLVPGAEALPNRWSTYALQQVTSLTFSQGHLLVRHRAAGQEAVLVYRPGQTPAGEYADCVVLQPGPSSPSPCPLLPPISLKPSLASHLNTSHLNTSPSQFPRPVEP